MANLFVVFTPLQVVVAQQIIRQENLVDNVMLESYLPDCEHFLEIYQMIRIDGIWKKVLPFDNWAYWDYSGGKLIRHIFDVKKKANAIEHLLRQNNIDNIYLADFQNQTNRFTCVWLANKGYKIFFYEEGYSHYIPRVGYPPSNNFFHRFYEHLLDGGYYLPLYHIHFANWRCYPNKDYHGLPIYCRYSIIPNIHHESYDKRLTYQPMASIKLQEFVKGDIGDYTNEDKILLLTDPMSEVLDAQYRYLYYETIKDSLDKYKEKHIYVKYHPRDSREDREEVINILENLRCEYSILGKRVNIPVEFYLQNTKFSTVLFFNTSTYFYNGYLFPEVKFIKLLPTLYNICKKLGVSRLKQMELLLEKMKD